MTASARKPHAFKPGDKVTVKETATRRNPAIILQYASYEGSSGPGYYASYDPPREGCASFWTHDGMLEPRFVANAPASADLIAA